MRRLVHGGANMRFRHCIVATSSLLFIAASPSIATAEPLQFTFQTTLDEVSEPNLRNFLGVNLHPGDALVGSLMLDSLGPDEDAQPTSGAFRADGTLSFP